MATVSSACLIAVGNATTTSPLRKKICVSSSISNSTQPAGPTEKDDLLAPKTTMDAVTLHVDDLGAMSEYYRTALALDEQDAGLWHPQTTATDAGSSRRASVVLAREGRPLIVLVHTPGLPVSRPGQAGLFHTALLYPDRPALAAVVAGAGRHPRSRYVGAADHLVSQAFYFTDPEGNGIELYWDRPREEWPRRDGQIQIDTLPLDVEAFMSEHLGVAGETTAQVGHVHLKVGDIEAARAFYIHTLGFEVTAEVGGALFFSAGGYHHHMGVNTWQSRGAGPRAATIGLGQVAILVPASQDLHSLAGRLREHGVSHRDDGLTLRFEDPWSTQLEVSSAAPR